MIQIRKFYDGGKFDLNGGSGESIPSGAGEKLQRSDILQFIKDHNHNKLLKLDTTSNSNMCMLVADMFEDFYNHFNRK